MPPGWDGAPTGAFAGGAAAAGRSAALGSARAPASAPASGSLRPLPRFRLPAAFAALRPAPLLAFLRRRRGEDLPAREVREALGGLGRVDLRPERRLLARVEGVLGELAEGARDRLPLRPDGLDRHARPRGRAPCRRSWTDPSTTYPVGPLLRRDRAHDDLALALLGRGARRPRGTRPRRPGPSGRPPPSSPTGPRGRRRRATGRDRGPASPRPSGLRPPSSRAPPSSPWSISEAGIETSLPSASWRTACLPRITGGFFVSRVRPSFRTTLSAESGPTEAMSPSTSSERTRRMGYLRSEQHSTGPGAARGRQRGLPPSSGPPPTSSETR